MLPFNNSVIYYTYIYNLFIFISYYVVTWDSVELNTFPSKPSQSNFQQIFDNFLSKMKDIKQKNTVLFKIA